MKKLVLLICFLALVGLACSLPQRAPTVSVDELTNGPAITPPGEPITATPSLEPAPTAESGTQVGWIHLSIPASVASGASAQIIAKAEGDQVAPWEAAPEHQETSLDGYTLQGSFHKPRIFIYPANDFLGMRPEIGGLYDQIRAAGSHPNDLRADAMPGVPFFNAAQMLAAQMKVLDFRNGSGVRLVTQYGQAAGPIDNQELFYLYEGLSSDGKYYLVAILPLNAPLLAPNGQQDAVVPPGGLAFNFNDANFDFQGYYNGITAQLNSTAVDKFTPGLDQLDALIASIEIRP